MKQVSNDDLDPALIPVGTRDWDKFTAFALSYSGYELRGEECAKIANESLRVYRERQVLPSTVDDLRTCLFFEQRRWRWSDYDPDEAAWRYINALLEALARKIELVQRTNR